MSKTRKMKNKYPDIPTCKKRVIAECPACHKHQEIEVTLDAKIGDCIGMPCDCNCNACLRIIRE
jgi:hypothetical protein